MHVMRDKMRKTYLRRQDLFRQSMSLKHSHSRHSKQKWIWRTTCEYQILTAFGEIPCRNILPVAVNVRWDSNLFSKVFLKGSRKHQRLRKLKWLWWRQSCPKASWIFFRNCACSIRNTYLQKGEMNKWYL